MSKQPPPAPTASAEGPCPTLIQISRTPRHWKFTQHHRATLPPLRINTKDAVKTSPEEHVYSTTVITVSIICHSSTDVDKETYVSMCLYVWEGMAGCCWLVLGVKAL